MQIIQQGFSIKNEVLEISSIKPGDAGTINGIDYSASVKFRSINVIEDEFEDTFKETEEIIEYKIPCMSSKEASQITDILRKLRVAKTPVYINTVIPKLHNGAQIYQATSIDNAEQFMFNNNAKILDKKEDKK